MNELLCNKDFAHGKIKQSLRCEPGSQIFSLRHCCVVLLLHLLVKDSIHLVKKENTIH